MNKKAFTLVELIVVITILAILATIGFISFQGYGVSSRDAVRLTDMRSIETGLNLILTKGEQLPMPDSKIDITASGTILTYQGYAGVGTLGEIGVNGGGVDPIDNSYYTYATNFTKNEFQLLGFLEKQSEISLIKNSYTDFKERFLITNGFSLGIILNNTSQEPIQKEKINIDIINGSAVEKDIIFLQEIRTSISEDNKYTFAYPRSSCKSILETGKSLGDGVYVINVNSELIDVYCDMTVDGGGWTLFYANNGNSDSPIKKSFRDMRTEVIENNSTRYNLSDYDYENLAGLLDYTIFNDLGQHEILASNRDFLKSEGRWLKVSFNNSDSFQWALSNTIIGTGYNSLGQCIEIPNNGTISVIASNNGKSLDNKYIMNHHGQGIGISHNVYTCNGYTGTMFPFALFYASDTSDDYKRSRSHLNIGGKWGKDNQYRYFIR